MSSTLNSSFRQELSIPTIMIKNPSISKPMMLTTSPSTPSPEGASQLRAMISRLEEIEIESRDLLKTLFSMLEKDAQLEQYLRKKRGATANKVSRMWELVEQVLDAHKGELDHLQHMLDTVDHLGENHGSIGGFSSIDKGLKMSVQYDGMVLLGTMGDDDSEEWRRSCNNDMRLDRFKIRTLDNDTKASGDDAGFR